MSEFFQLLSGLLGVVIGWCLNEFSTERRIKPKMCFRITNTPDSELTEKDFRTSTSLSEYSIEIYNTGQTPFILENFSLVHKKKLLVDCYMGDPSDAILPYKSTVYTMMEQDTSALEWHCKELHLKKCTVLAYDIEGKCYKTKLDVSWIALRLSLNHGNVILPEDI